jgi:di/tricarboxylate transporter
MLAIGGAIERSGLLSLIVTGASPVLAMAGPLAALAAIYVIASLLTEIVTNNAVAIVLTPLAIGLAQALGADPRPFVIAVMFASSASFLTPIGYQTNTLVYNAGGYKFADFFRFGWPLNIAAGVVAIFGIPIFWPL